jgi:hypothetical protein
VEAVFHRGCVAAEKDSERRILGQGMGEEAFAGGSGEEGQVELAELIEVGEERVVFVEAFAEAEAWVEDNLDANDAGGGGGLEAVGEFGEDEGEDFGWCEGWEMGPVLGTASGVHQNGSAAKFGAGGGHGGVPEVAADVVDDLGSGFDGEAGGGGVEGVDGEDGLGAVFEDGCDDGEDAGLLFVGREWGGVGAGGFAADVEDVGAFVEHRECLREGSFGGVPGGVEEAAVGEAVGGDVEDAHDERPLAQSEGAGAEAPVEAGAGGEGHGAILSVTVISNLSEKLAMKLAAGRQEEIAGC